MSRIPGLPPAARLPSSEDVRAPAPAYAVLPVSLFVSSARLILERHLGLVWVSGEVSNFTRAASGHCYFNLKDAQAQVRCVFFKSRAQFAEFALRDGLAVEVRAVASIYEPRGEFQLNVETVRLAGQGALYERFARLKARLEAEGWFAPERKRALPPWPRAVGIVTSTRAAALSDLLAMLRKRWPPLRVVVYPATVQGDGAAPSIARAIRAANERAEVEVLIVARGGGSIEDLWAFNEEVVARAVFESALPVVSGVGHETDVTICDFVADVRAPTPTAAAALVAPDREAVARHVASVAGRLRHAQLRKLETAMQRVDGAARRLVHPATRIERQARDAALLADRMARALRHRLDAASGRVGGLAQRIAWRLAQPLPQSAALAPAALALTRAARARYDRLDTRVAVLARSLAHLNPQAVLERGYAIVTAGGGAIVEDAGTLAVGEHVDIAFARGTAGATIDKV
ncbi:MAG TPA: exodeoxyribonuclease VII large subunit [Casimicrobiaceae bacterium]|nr:exodeoxyribonuclease VII large subunit [Casimicrobiaceae bacterium]